MRRLPDGSVLAVADNEADDTAENWLRIVHMARKLRQPGESMDQAVAEAERRWRAGDRALAAEV